MLLNPKILLIISENYFFFQILAVIMKETSAEIINHSFYAIKGLKFTVIHIAMDHILSILK